MRGRGGLAGAVLLLASLGLWLTGLALARKSPLAHDPSDQHARQALAWLAGRAHIDPAPLDLELAVYGGRHYVSFPPTPTLVQAPLVLLFGPDTPTGAALFAFSAAAALSVFRMALRAGRGPALAAVAGLGFVFGTNVYPSMVQGGVWAEGQVLGFCLAVFALDAVTAGRPALGYLLLSLAVGCRPFYLFLTPVLLALDAQRGRPARAVLRDAVLAMAPYGLFLAAYNHARFGSPLEFGHLYLPWPQSLEHGEFGVAYLSRNLWHAFLKLPRLGEGAFLQFHGRGTAFWVNNPLLLVALWGLVSGPLAPRVRAASGVSLAAVWLGLLLHESGGWFQFGYRYAIDLLPVGALLFVHRFRSASLGLTLLLHWSLLVNLYGIWWFRATPRPYLG